MVLTRKVRIVAFLLLPLVMAVACLLLELGLKNQGSLTASLTAFSVVFLVALAFVLEQCQTGPIYLEFQVCDFGWLRSLKFKIDLPRSTFIAGVTLLMGAHSIIGHNNARFGLNCLSLIVVFFVVQVVCSQNFLQTFAGWCGLSFSCQLLSFFHSGGTQMGVWWGMSSRSGCFFMMALCFFLGSIYGSFDYGLILALAGISSSSHLTAFGGGAGLLVLDVMSILVLLGAMGPALEALLLYFSSGRETLPQSSLLELVVMGAVGCFLVHTWAAILKYSSILGPSYALVASFFGY